MNQQRRRQKTGYKVRFCGEGVRPIRAATNPPRGTSVTTKTGTKSASQSPKPTPLPKPIPPLFDVCSSHRLFLVDKGSAQPIASSLTPPNSGHTFFCGSVLCCAATRLKKHYYLGFTLLLVPRNMLYIRGLAPVFSVNSVLRTPIVAAPWVTERVSPSLFPRSTDTRTHTPLSNHNKQQHQRPPWGRVGWIMQRLYMKKINR